MALNLLPIVLVLWLMIGVGNLDLGCIWFGFEFVCLDACASFCLLFYVLLFDYDLFYLAFSGLVAVRPVGLPLWFGMFVLIGLRVRVLDDWIWC